MTPGHFSSFVDSAVEAVQQTPLWLCAVIIVTSQVALVLLLYLALCAFAPYPREPLKDEKKYISIAPDGKSEQVHDLPCWYDTWKAKRRKEQAAGLEPTNEIEPPEVYLSVIVPAYNEEKRLTTMLEEAVEFLDAEYGALAPPAPIPPIRHRKPTPTANGTPSASAPPVLTGYEILIVSDGSTDATIATALAFARAHTHHLQSPSPIRVVALSANRGKGGAVTHGLRHARGAYAIFADADGASAFRDARKLLRAARIAAAADPRAAAVAVGSRAHLVATDAVVKRSALRNALMHGFHLLLRLMTPPATSRIRDTQCGFKLFSRAALAQIVPYMHCEGWIFDVEVLMLAEGAGVPMVECAVGWREVGGSKLNVVWDSVGMAVGLAVVRAAWMLGVYRREVR